MFPYREFVPGQGQQQQQQQQQQHQGGQPPQQQYPWVSEQPAHPAVPNPSTPIGRPIDRSNDRPIDRSTHTTTATTIQQQQQQGSLPSLAGAQPPPQSPQEPTPSVLRAAVNAPQFVPKGGSGGTPPFGAQQGPGKLGVQVCVGICVAGCLL
jgi:hypothetical protein